MAFAAFGNQHTYRYRSNGRTDGAGGAHKSYFKLMKMHVRRTCSSHVNALRQSHRISFARRRAHLHQCRSRKQTTHNKCSYILPLRGMCTLRDARCTGSQTAHKTRLSLIFASWMLQPEAKFKIVSALCWLFLWPCAGAQQCPCTLHTLDLILKIIISRFMFGGRLICLCILTPEMENAIINMIERTNESRSNFQTEFFDK